MTRTITIDVDTGQATTTGNITAQDLTLTHAASIAAALLHTAETNLGLAEALHATTINTLDKAMNIARGLHDD